MRLAKAGAAILMCGVLMALAGCGGGASTNLSPDRANMAPAPQKAFEPECYSSVGRLDSNYIYGKGTIKSVDRQSAIDQADLIAATDIAANMERWVQERDFMREEDFQKFAAIRDSVNAGATGERSFQNERKSIVSKVIKGTEEHCNEVYVEGGQYLVFRVLRLGVGKANKALYDEIVHNEELMRMYKDSEALKVLEEDVRKFEELKSKK